MKQPTASSAYASSDYRRNRHLVLELAGGKCFWPGCDRSATTADHIIPVAAGGTNAFANLRAACLHHNSAGGAQIANVIRSA
jgi:hypothetical protein